MARRHWAGASAIAVIVAMGAAGCSNNFDATPTPPDRGTIGLAMPTQLQTHWVDDGNQIVKQLALLGYKTDLEYADDKAPTQVGQVASMVDHNVRVLVIGAVDGTALKDVLSQAGAKKIPVIAYDRLILGSADVSYYAGFDGFKVGVEQGLYLVKTLGVDHGAGPFNIELVAGAATDHNSTLFFDGAMSVLKPYLASGKLVVRSGQVGFTQVVTENWDAAVVQKRMAAIIGSTYSTASVDAVLSPNDGLARGVLAAFRAANKKLPAISGQDAELDSVKLIAAGQQGMTVFKDSREQAKVAVQMVNMLLTDGKPQVNDNTQNNGVKVVPSFLLQPVSVDKSNYQRILVDGGYYTAAQITS